MPSPTRTAHDFIDEFGTAWPVPHFSRSEVDKAGRVLIAPKVLVADLAQAHGVLNNWRASHGYPDNAIQATLRNTVLNLGYTEALVSQRLKRTPSIVGKLKRFNSMKLSRMQDTGGIRVVLPTIFQVNGLRSACQELVPRQYNRGHTG